MAHLIDRLGELLMILATLAPIAISVFFVVIGFRQPMGQGRVTCLVLAAVALLPIVFLVMLGIAIQDD